MRVHVTTANNNNSSSSPYRASQHKYGTIECHITINKDSFTFLILHPICHASCVPVWLQVASSSLPWHLFVTQIRGYIGPLPPPPPPPPPTTTVYFENAFIIVLLYYRENGSALSSLVDSCQTAHTHDLRSLHVNVNY